MKTFIVRVTEKGSHGKYGKMTYCEFEVSALNKQNAEEKAKEFMYSKTYGELFPKLNEPEVREYINCYTFARVLKTSEYIGLNQYGCPMYKPFTEEEIISQIDSKIKEDIFERVQFIIKTKKF